MRHVHFEKLIQLEWQKCVREENSIPLNISFHIIKKQLFSYQTTPPSLNQHNLYCSTEIKKMKDYSEFP